MLKFFGDYIEFDLMAQNLSEGLSDRFFVTDLFDMLWYEFTNLDENWKSQPSAKTLMAVIKLSLASEFVPRCCLLGIKKDLIPTAFWNKHKATLEKARCAIKAAEALNVHKMAILSMATAAERDYAYMKRNLATYEKEHITWAMDLAEIKSKNNARNFIDVHQEILNYNEKLFN